MKEIHHLGESERVQVDKKEVSYELYVSQFWVLRDVFPAWKMIQHKNQVVSESVRVHKCGIISARVVTFQKSFRDDNSGLLLSGLWVRKVAGSCLLGSLPTCRHLESADFKMCQVNAAGNQEFRALALKKVTKKPKNTTSQ